MSTLMTVREEPGGTQPFAHPLFSFIPGIDKALSVPTLDAATLTKEVFEKQWVARNRPCLVKGAVKHWPAVEKWPHREYWTNRIENYQAVFYPHGNYINQGRPEVRQETLPFHSAMERLFQDEEGTFSMPGEQIVKGSLFEKLAEDLPGFTFLPSPPMPIWYERMRFFAYRRASTNWHYHGVDETLMCQVKGTKRVALLSPRIPRIRQITRFLHEERYLEGQTLDPTLVLNPYLVDVCDGDALYIPPYWHHAVAPVDGEAGFTVAFCWRSPYHILGNFSNFMVRSIYLQGMWPLKPMSVILPFLGCYAGLSYSIKRLTGQV